MGRFVLPLVALCAFAVSGCVGADGQQAEALLHQAEQAQAAVTSERFVMRYDIDLQGHELSMAMQGGAYLKGPRRGDFYFSVNGSGAPELDNLTMTIVKHGRAAALQANGQTQRIALPAARRQFGSPAEMLDLARYVTSVSVERSEYDGRSADKIVGKLDTHALLGSAGLASKLLEGAGVHFGDIRAVLYIPRDTHLVEVMFADLDVQGGGQTAHMHLSIATRDVNKPLAIPQL